MVNIFTARKRSLGQGNIFIGVCQEFCSQGGSASVHARNEAVHAGKEAPPGKEPVHAGKEAPPKEAVHAGKEAPHYHAPSPQDHAPPPPGTREIRRTRGWYASYWNAILSTIIVTQPMRRRVHCKQIEQSCFSYFVSD